MNADSGGAQALVTTPDGGAVIAAGLYGCCNGSFLSFTRLTQAGYTSKAFGNGGRLWYHDVPGGCGDDDSLSVNGGGVRLSNGTYRFAGQMNRCGTRSGLILGLDAAGRPDNRVGSSGLAAPAVLAGRRVWSMGADASNRLYLLAEESADTLKLIRTDRDRVVDTTYADQGSLTLGLAASRRHVITPLTKSVPTLKVSWSGQVYVGFSARTSDHSTDNVAVVAHVGSTGVLDTAFGRDGYAAYHPAVAGGQGWLTSLGVIGSGRLVLGLQYRKQSVDWCAADADRRPRRRPRPDVRQPWCRGLLDHRGRRGPSHLDADRRTRVARKRQREHRRQLEAAGCSGLDGTLPNGDDWGVVTATMRT